MAVADAWAGQTVLVTGAAGLLGGSVSARFLEAGAHVAGLDIAWDGPRAAFAPAGIDKVDGDIRDADLLSQVIGDLRVTTVIHLAAQTLVGPALLDPVDTFSNNIEGTWTVLEACRSAGTVGSIVVASSDKAYGDWSGRPYREDMALRARHPYDVSKAATDLLAQSYAGTYNLPITVTRCGNLYGGGDVNWSRIVPGTIRSVLEGEAPVIRSDGTFIRDYLHVSDAARGVLMLARAGHERPDLRGEAFNFAGRDHMAVLDIVHRILALMESRLEPNVLGLDVTEIPEQRVAAAKARRLLDWRPEVTIVEGLREAIAWYRANLSTVT